jgi:hypothetical protein
VAFLPISGAPSATPVLVFAIEFAPVLYRTRLVRGGEKRRPQEEARSRSRYANLGRMSEHLAYSIGRPRHDVTRRVSAAPVRHLARCTVTPNPSFLSAPPKEKAL